MSFLKLDNVKKVYPNGFCAVEGFNLEIEKGEFIVFLGPSGCGKTTIMRMIAGLEKITDGKVNLEDKIINDVEIKDRDISMIFQSYAVWPHMKVFDNVAYPLKLKKMKKADIKKEVEEAGKVTDIIPYLDRYPNQLSGGQRQRVAVARAIVVKPKLFLMDEPLSNLDAKLRISMRTDLKQIHHDLNSTTIFVTHDQAEAMSLADRIVVMNHGVIEQVGTPNEIYHDSETMFVAKFIGSPPANFFDAKVTVDGDKCILNIDDYKIEVTGDVKETLTNNYLGKDVVFAVRPEDVQVNKGNNNINTNITIVEPQGPTSILLANVLGANIKIVTDNIQLKKDDNITVCLDSKFMLFDKETEKRIR